MAISINWATRVINIPRTDMTLLQASPEIRQLDIDDFRLALKDLEDDEAGMLFPTTHNHNTEVVVGGVTLARVVEIINSYTITFEDGQYAVKLVGANSNISDVVNVNQVSIRSGNSAGLTTPGLSGTDVFDGRTLENILIDLLAMASGRIVETSPGVFSFYERDNTTVRYTLTKAGSQRSRS